MKIIAILNDNEVFFKKEPLNLLSEALKIYDITFIYPEDEKDLLNVLENNQNLRGVIFDWDQYSLELCEKISQFNELMPIYAFTHRHTQLDIDFSQLNLNVHFFEYAIDSVTDIALKIKQITDIYINNLLPPFTKALFKYVDEGKYTFCTPGHMGGTAFQKSPVGSVFYDFFGRNTMKSDLSVSVSEL
ncbi:lysine decarboxylase LdcC, partial [Salmonella enterica subsp. enterica serovar Kottbus]|nr:lysine decarboxylase LdcC [Salmonella enterica subsp. enterica serovar Kottbus]EDL0055556.1 lysine decarboxylase LdcC [Salmonella enterica subsp. enterica serovar Kottbus]